MRGLGRRFAGIALVWLVQLFSGGMILAEAAESPSPVESLISIDQLGLPALGVLSLSLYLIRVTHKFSVAITDWRNAQTELQEAAQRSKEKDEELLLRVRKLEVHAGIYDPEDEH